MVDFAAIANNAIAELKRAKGSSLRFNAPIYLAINADDSIESSNLWFILNDATFAVILYPYTYRVLTAEDTSAFVLFIDDKGHCSDNIYVNGWNIRFDSPKERFYRTYNRYATISKSGHEITLATPGRSLTLSAFTKIWNYFKLISNKNDDYASLYLYKELYDKDIIIESLKNESVRKEYERLIAKSLLKANEALLENLKQIINKTK